MAGKLCSGVATDQPTLRESRAYAEGRAAAIAGGLVTDNPEDGLGSPAEAAWDRGFASEAEDPAGWPLGQDCVAELPGSGYVPE